eukprot:6179090-Pleurochrysis_carterae.AAC.4
MRIDINPQYTQIWRVINIESAAPVRALYSLSSTKLPSLLAIQKHSAAMTAVRDIYLNQTAVVTYHFDGVTGFESERPLACLKGSRVEDGARPRTPAQQSPIQMVGSAGMRELWRVLAHLGAMCFMRKSARLRSSLHFGARCVEENVLVKMTIYAYIRVDGCLRERASIVTT